MRTQGEKVCENYAGPKLQNFVYDQLDDKLGEFKIPGVDEPVGWRECVETWLRQWSPNESTF